MLFFRTNPFDDLLAADILDTRGITEYEKGQYREAALFVGHAIDIKQTVQPNSHLSTLWSRHNLSVVYTGLGRFEEALRVTEEVVEDFGRVLGPDHPYTLQGRESLAEIKRLRRGTSAA